MVVGYALANAYVWALCLFTLLGCGVRWHFVCGLFQVCIACMIWFDRDLLVGEVSCRLFRLDMFARTYWLGTSGGLPMGMCRRTLGLGCRNLQCDLKLSIGRDLAH